MSTEDPVGTTEDQARALGWRPQEEFRGNPDNWVDAETFLDRGTKTMPGLQSDRRRLLGEVQALKERDAQREAEIKAIRENVGELVKVSVAEARQKADADIKAVRAELIEARRSGDTEAELAAEERLEAAREAKRQIKDEPKEEQTETKPNGKEPHKYPPDVVQAMNEFIEENPWYNASRSLAGAANAMTLDLMQDEDFASLTPKQRMDRIAERMHEEYGPQIEKALGGGPGRRQKVEGGGGAVRRPTGGRSYADMPDDAKATCARQEAKFVGKGKAFESQADWRKHYAANYFGDE